MDVMDRSGRMSFAYVKNRAEQNQLDAELQRLDKEKKAEMRAMNTEQKKFRARYSKLSLASNEGSAVRMYETHNPGFCYRRNGEQKNVQQVQVNPSIDFKLIHYLLFTNGEVDVEKILCLHLVSAHRAETLTPPKKKTKYVCKEHSPVERLIDRSKRGFANFEKLSILLPLYTVELSDKEADAMGEIATPLINDGRLAARILVNEKIRELINTVVNGLEHSNHQKLRQLIVLANDTSALRRMLGKKNALDFLDTLYDHSLINSCESYNLTPPFKVKTRDLDIKTVSGNIENLIKHIRTNVLQPPSANAWKVKLKEQKELEAELQQKASPTIKAKTEVNNPPVSNTPSQSSKNSSKFEMHSKREASRRPPEEEKEEKRFSRRGTINFIARNIEAAGKVKKIEYDPDEDDYIPPKRASIDSTRFKRRSLDVKKNIQGFLSAVESAHKEAIAEEEASNEKIEIATPSDSIDDTNSDKRKSSTDSHEHKYHIKQTTCPACMEKWRTPLPSPKTPRIRKSSVVPSETPGLRTHNQNRISMLINKEMYKMQSYDRRYSNDSEASRRPIVKKKENDSDALDNVNLNPMDLAKIEQEIKERETRKKLEKFLKATQ